MLYSPTNAVTQFLLKLSLFIHLSAHRQLNQWTVYEPQWTVDIRRAWYNSKTVLAKGSNKILRHFPKYMNYQLNKCIGKMIKIQLVAYDMKKWDEGTT